MPAAEGRPRSPVASRGGRGKPAVSPRETGGQAGLSSPRFPRLEENWPVCFRFTATKDEAKKHRYRQKISEYMTRAEDIKKHIEKEKQGMELQCTRSHLNTCCYVNVLWARWLTQELCDDLY